MKLFKLFNLKSFIIGLIIALIGIAVGCGFGININTGIVDNTITISAGFSLQLSDEQIPALIENAEGEEVTDKNIVTVEEVAGEQIAQECPEGEECGQGRYIYAPTENFTWFNLSSAWI